MPSIFDTRTGRTLRLVFPAVFVRWLRSEVRLSVFSSNCLAAGDDMFKVAGSPRKATHYVVHVDIKGLAGVLAPLLGKDPPDSHVWILQGEAPAFIKSEAPLFAEGPLWRIELTSPTW